MKFCDRDAFFEHRAIYAKQIPSLEIREEEIMGKYRGAPWYSRRLTTSYRRSRKSKNSEPKFQRRLASISKFI